MTIPRLRAFADYWLEAPPVNEVVVAIFSTESTGTSANTTKPDEIDFGTAEELMALIPTTTR